MTLNNEVFLPISVDILDMDNVIEAEEGFIIPLKRTVKNQKRYDNMYNYIGKYSDFAVEITESKLSLAVRLNSIGQFAFSLSADFTDFTDFNIQDISDVSADEHYEEVYVVLHDEELEAIFPIISNLFDSEKLSIENLRLQVASAIPKKHMKDTMLFSEEIIQNAYHCVWVTEDFKKCVLASIEDIENKSGLVKVCVY